MALCPHLCRAPQELQVLVVLEEGASATVIEEYAGGTGTAVLSSVAEFFCAPGSRLTSVVLQDAATDATVANTRRIRIEERAESSMTLLATGAGRAKFALGALLLKVLG